MKIPKPDYETIRKYLPDANSEWFSGIMNNGKRISDGAYRLYCGKFDTPEFGDDNLYFFWVYYADLFENTTYFQSIQLYSEQNKYNKELEDLQIFLKTVITGNNKAVISIDDEATKKKNGEVVMKAIPAKKNLVLESLEIKAKNVKTKTLKISSHALLYDLVSKIELWAQKPTAVQNHKTFLSTYLKEFAKKTYPLYLYLKDNGFEHKKQIETFDEVERITKLSGVDWLEIATSGLTEDYLERLYRKVRNEVAS